MGGTRQGSQVDMITGGGERTELRARVERDSSERTGGERRHSRKRGGVAGGGVSEPGSEYRIAQPGSPVLLFHREAPGGPPEQSHSWEVKQRARSVRLAGRLYPSTAHPGSGRGLDPGKKKM